MSALLDAVRGYYTGRLAEHGPTPRGVDWNGAESQETRFRQLLRVLEGTPGATLGDFGCGYGALLPFARSAGFSGEYRGYDLAPAMVAAARDRYAADPLVRFEADEAVLATTASHPASRASSASNRASGSAAWRSRAAATIAGAGS